ncbi:molybdenum cofactor guanylyltransferase [Tessaracoccus sp. G1721]
MTMGRPTRCAVVLGGGRSSRMGTDKLELRLGARSLLRRSCDAALTWAPTVVVASPWREGFDDPRLTFVLEDPPFGGPVAGLAAAVAALPADASEVLLLAGDLADPQAVVDALARAQPGEDGVALVDMEGWPQYLAARYRAAALRRAIADAPAVRDVSVRRVMRGLTLSLAEADERVTADVDTPGQARLAGLDG